MSYYHYTKGCLLPSIVKDGIIKTSKSLVEKKEKPAVWLTKSPEWEKSCNIGKIVSQTELKPGCIYSSDEVRSVTVDNNYMKNEVGMCRILISETAQTVSFAKFKHVSGISERMYNALESYSRSIGCQVGKWLCSFNPIPKKYWEGIEMFVGDQWVKWDETIPIEQFIDVCLSCNRDKKSMNSKVKRVFQNVFNTWFL